MQIYLPRLLPLLRFLPRTTDPVELTILSATKGRGFRGDARASRPGCVDCAGGGRVGLELLGGGGGEDTLVGGGGDLDGDGRVGFAPGAEEGGREDFLIF